ncbi:MAG: hypothetical protein OXU42_06965 [Deltaproteobacteria bacterium]|nr:hypothetical protein [Deltaproteobacteria bacterium]
MTRSFAFAIAIGITFVVFAVVATEATRGGAVSPLPDRREDELRVHFYNVGAGTCTVVECPGPNARPIIVDCGRLAGGRGKHAISDQELKTRIRDTLGDRSPEVVLSHSDLDHVSLIPHVLGEVQISAVWQGDDPEDYPKNLRSWVLRQQEQGAAIHGRFAKDWHNDGQPIANGLDCGTASSYVLTVNSGEPATNSSDDDNANSLVLMLKYGSFGVIFTGDATGVTESAAIANFGDGLRATVLTASHHGASSEGSNSAAWAAATRPAVVVYSAGTLYGHPTCATRQTLSDSLAETPKHHVICGKTADGENDKFSTRAEYMTRVNGAITITTDGEAPLRLDCEVGPGCAAIEIPFDK